MTGTNRLVLLSMLTAMALALHIVERLIPIPIAMPGVKLGLANVVTLLAILLLGWRDALVVVTLRCLLGSIYGGNLITFLFSIGGGLLSTIIMALLWHKFSRHVSIISISLMGAVGHNIGQLFMASLIIQDFRIYTYLPVLLVSGVITGYIVGVIATRSYTILNSHLNYMRVSGK